MIYRKICFLHFLVIILYPHCLLTMPPHTQRQQWQVPLQLVSALPFHALRTIGQLAPITRSVGASQWATIAPLWSSLLHRSATADVVSLQSLVSNHIDSIMRDLFPDQPIGELEAKTPGLEHLCLLKRAIAVLDGRMPMYLKLEELRKLGESHSDQLLDELDMTTFFIPDRRRLISKLQKAPEAIEQLLDASVGTHLHRLKKLLAALEPLREEMRSGKRKKDLVSWWLYRIRVEMMECLSER